MPEGPPRSTTATPSSSVSPCTPQQAGKVRLRGRLCAGLTTGQRQARKVHAQPGSQGRAHWRGPHLGGPVVQLLAVDQRPLLPFKQPLVLVRPRARPPQPRRPRRGGRRHVHAPRRRCRSRRRSLGGRRRRALAAFMPVGPLAKLGAAAGSRLAAGFWRLERTQLEGDEGGEDEAVGGTQACCGTACMSALMPLSGAAHNSTVCSAAGSPSRFHAPALAAAEAAPAWR